MLRVLHSLDKAINIVFRIVKIKTGSRGGCNTELLQKWLGTMVAGSNRDTLLVQQRRDIVRVHAINSETYDASTMNIRCGPEYGHTSKIVQSTNRLAHEFVLVFGDGIKPDVVEIIQSSTERNGVSN